jgi:large subunit ribosomal protein L18
MSIENRTRRARERRATRVRSKVRGTPARPRLSVFRSNRGIYAQIIDDLNGRTLVSVSVKHVDVAADLKRAEAATKVGSVLAERAKAQGIERVVFDRGRYLYHGRVKALADGAREGGLEF